MEENKVQHISAFAKKLTAKYGPAFCMAKWKHLTLYLQLGQGHSCYHPQPQKISLDEIAKNPSALHNTSAKIAERAKMLKGERPDECSYCWNIENLNEDHLSDRHLKSFEESKGVMENVQQVFEQGLSEHVIPSYVEVSFSSKCNFKCIYCNPKASSTWEDEIKKFGPYQDIENRYEIDQEIFEEENEYVDAFKKWWPTLTKELYALRITGGEPLLHKTTYELLEEIIEKPKDSLMILLNSNLGVQEGLVRKLCDLLNTIEKNNALKKFRLYTSLESVGERAEYVRKGLNYELWQKNVRTYLATTNSELSFMCTYNVLSVTDFTNFLKMLLELKREFCKDRKRIKIDIPYLEYPRMFHLALLGDKYKKYLLESIEFMKNNSSESDNTLFDSLEIGKLQRIYDLWQSKPLSEKEIELYTNDFFKFQKQSDLRRNQNFREIFPELENFKPTQAGI